MPCWVAPSVQTLLRRPQACSCTHERLHVPAISGGREPREGSYRSRALLLARLTFVAGQGCLNFRMISARLHLTLCSADHCTPMKTGGGNRSAMPALSCRQECPHARLVLLGGCRTRCTKAGMRCYAGGPNASSLVSKFLAHAKCSLHSRIPRNAPSHAVCVCELKHSKNRPHLDCKSAQGTTP